MNLKQINNLVTRRKYRLTLHAEVERDAEEITLQEIEEALLSKKAEIIEDYPNDPRGPELSYLRFYQRKLASSYCLWHREPRDFSDGYCLSARCG